MSANPFVRIRPALLCNEIVLLFVVMIEWAFFKQLITACRFLSVSLRPDLRALLFVSVCVRLVVMGTVGLVYTKMYIKNPPCIFSVLPITARP